MNELPDLTRLTGAEKDALIYELFAQVITLTAEGIEPDRVGKRPYRLPTRTRNGEIGGQTKKRLPTLHIWP